MPTDSIVDQSLELLAPLGPLRSKRMFGGHGIWADELFVAFVSGRQLYLKVGDASRQRFADAGCEPFSFVGKGGQRVALGFWTAPAEALDSPAAMAPWARLALQAALAARRASIRRPPQSTRKAPLR